MKQGGTRLELSAEINRLAVMADGGLFSMERSQPLLRL